MPCCLRTCSRMLKSYFLTVLEPQDLNARLKPIAARAAKLCVDHVAVCESHFEAQKADAKRYAASRPPKPHAHVTDAAPIDPKGGARTDNGGAQSARNAARLHE